VLINEDFGLFAQDQWQVRPNVTINYGLRWDAQLMADPVDPATTAYASFVNNPAFLSEGTIPDQLAEFQPRFGIAWDVKRTVKQSSAQTQAYYARNNMLSQADPSPPAGFRTRGGSRAVPVSFLGLFRCPHGRGSSRSCFRPAISSCSPPCSRRPITCPRSGR
jgi:hypothetical protein